MQSASSRLLNTSPYVQARASRGEPPIHGNGSSKDTPYAFVYRALSGRVDILRVMPDHSTLSRIRSRLSLEVHQEVFACVPGVLTRVGLVRGDRIGVDASTMEANAANSNTQQNSSKKCFEHSMHSEIHPDIPQSDTFMYFYEQNIGLYCCTNYEIKPKTHEKSKNHPMDWSYHKNNYSNT